jgi:hypothetical protein
MTVTFTPLLPLTWLLPLLAIAAMLLAIGLFKRLRGMMLRTAALVLLALALLNPALQLEDRETLSTIVPIVVDRSASQTSAERRVQTDTTLEQLQQQ